MYRLEVGQLVVVGVDARAEEEPRVPPVDDLHAAELDEVGLVLLVARGDQPVDFAFELDFLFILDGGLGEAKCGKDRGERIGVAEEQYAVWGVPFR